MKKRTASLIVLSILFCFYTGCGKKDPGEKAVAVVSLDTLKAKDVQHSLTKYAEIKGLDSTSITPEKKKEIGDLLIQTWIDIKLILRQARSEKFEFDKTFAVDDVRKAAQYMGHLIKSNSVTNWEVQEYRKKTSDPDTSFEAVKQKAQVDKMMQVVREIRRKGGYRLLDKSCVLKDEPVLLEDSTKDAAQLVLSAYFPLLGDDMIKAVSVAAKKLQESGGVDSTILSEIAAMTEKKPEAPMVVKAPPKKKSKAHLYRNSESLQTAIKKYLGDVQLKFKRELKRNPSMHGRVTVKILIAADGSVPDAMVFESEFRDDQFMKVLEDFIKTWKFPEIPEAAGELVVNYPFDFKSSE